MTQPFRLTDNNRAGLIVGVLQQSGYPDAKLNQVGSGYEVRVGLEKYLAIEDDRNRVANTIVAAIVKNAEDGDLEAAEWLEARGVVELPTKDD